jgi:trehalose 6-phosphate synthase
MRSIRSADAVCQEIDSEDPIVLVQDYHFALAPRMIRERLPRANVIMFWDIPWRTPNDSLFARGGRHRERLSGRLAEHLAPPAGA